MSRKASEPDQSIGVDEVLGFSAHAGVVWVDMLSDGKLVRLKMGVPTLLAGIGGATALVRQGNIVPMRKDRAAQHG